VPEVFFSASCLLFSQLFAFQPVVCFSASCLLFSQLFAFQDEAGKMRVINHGD
jgi:hypothetical protein